MKLYCIHYSDESLRSFTYYLAANLNSFSKEFQKVTFNLLGLKPLFSAWELEWVLYREFIMMDNESNFYEVQSIGENEITITQVPYGEEG